MAEISIQKRASFLLAGIKASRRRRAQPHKVRHPFRDGPRRGIWADLDAIMPLLKDMPVRVGARRFLLSEKVTPGSKAAQLVGELKHIGVETWSPCGIQADVIWGIRRMRLGFRALCLLVSLRSRGRKLDQRDWAFVIASLVAKWGLRSGPDTMVVILADMSPRRIAMATGASLAGNQLMLYQYDNNLQAPPALGWTHAALRSEAGLSAVKDHQLILGRLLTCPPRAIDLSRDGGVWGMAVNAIPEPDLLGRVETLREYLSIDRIRFRLHPRRATIDGDPSQYPWLDIAPPGETLEDFCDSCDLVVCGNSAVQLKVLLTGTPVIHVGALDTPTYDNYGFVDQGVVYGSPTPDGVSLDAMKAHYRRPSVMEAMQRNTSIPDSAGIPDLETVLG
ncbi:hypothetical protein [Actibacterium sp. 188UL27-1]|uniref:hypothetical protein n=1 Tax=Actibacterium sp. 188UL27-1 TaxID=2786961 RepID=UPI001957F846|nr:hypothetical protein [Actibacterium sp. 188UL27-1]MBM7068579.1 hypothetical protein [Actibacterium sp. 188UL27-1]